MHNIVNTFFTGVASPAVDHAYTQRTFVRRPAGFSGLSVVTFSGRHSYADFLPNCRLQKLSSRGTRRAEALRAALHSFTGIQLLGNAPRNRAGQRSARAAAR